jgi:hypothetical protein
MFIWIHGVQKFVLFILGDVLGLLLKFSLRLRYIQLIWTLSMQEYVLSILGDLLMCFETAFRCSFVSQSSWSCRQREWRQWQVKLAEREVWCGRLVRLEDGEWRYCRFDATC